MMEILLRLLILLSCLMSCIYGIFTIHKSFRPSFYKIALCGMFAFFLSRLFYFVLTLTNGDDRAFSIGVLGQSTAYLFYIIANRAYVPQEEEERMDNSLCFPAFMVAVIPCAIMLASAFVAGSIGAYIGEILYIVTMGPAAYYACYSIRNQYNNPFRKQIAPFNTCVCILIYANAFSELVTVTSIEAVLAISKYVLTLITVPTLLVMLPILRKGLRPWEI